MVENIEIATFSKNAKQFMQCTTVIDKTTELKCKVGNIWKYYFFSSWFAVNVLYTCYKAMLVLLEN